MVEPSICFAEERHALIIGYSRGEPPLPEVFDDVKVVERFAKKQNFSTIKTLIDDEATSN